APFDATWNDTLYKSSSAFADLSYQLTDKLTLGAGARYFRDHQDYANTDLTAQLVTLQTGKFHSTDPRAYIRYKVTDQINTYATAAKGFRSGGFNNPGIPDYGPEKIWSYELGTKMSLLQNRLRLDAAVFTSDYNDYQVVGLGS